MAIVKFHGNFPLLRSPGLLGAFRAEVSHLGFPQAAPGLQLPTARGLSFVHAGSRGGQKCLARSPRGGPGERLFYRHRETCKKEKVQTKEHRFGMKNSPFFCPDLTPMRGRKVPELRQSGGQHRRRFKPKWVSSRAVEAHPKQEHMVCPRKLKKEKLCKQKASPSGK